MSYSGGTMAAPMPDAKERVEDVTQLIRQGRLDRAEQLARGALEGVPASARPLRQLAIIADRRGDRVLAVEYARQALAASPKDPDSHNVLAVQLQRIGELEEAEQTVKA